MSGFDRYYIKNGKLIEEDLEGNLNGVNEQWVYDGYKYIYLEDGIVTSIQE